MRAYENIATDDLPNLAITRDGFKFDPSKTRWKIEALVGSALFDFTKLVKFDQRMVNCVMRTMLWYVQHKSISHCSNMFAALCLFHRKSIPDTEGVVGSVELNHILLFSGTLNKSTEWKLGTLRVLLEKAHRLGNSILSKDARAYLKSKKIRGNVKGTSIRTRDPSSGAFSDIELQGMQVALNGAYADGTISLYVFCLAWLLLAYGLRPIQIAALKESDLILSDNGSERSYVLKIPRGKQRNTARTSFKFRHCGKPLGELIETVISSNAATRQNRGLDGEDWPLFLAKYKGNLPGLNYHISSSTIVGTISKWVGRVTNIKANAKRFRNTIGQRAVDDGADIYTVAELLDHSDTQNAMVYFEAGPSTVLRLDRSLASELAPLAQAFAGMAVETDASNHLRSDGSRTLYDGSLLDNVADPIGECGQMSFCGLAVPHACYTCRHFQPWIDGPHEEVVIQLLDDRQRMIDAGRSPSIYTIRDRTILAAAEVVRLCEEAKAQLEGTLNV